MANVGGDENDNVLEGTTANDVLTGNAGNDTLLGREGADTLDGGTGEDAASYGKAAQGVVVNLVAGADPNTGEAAGDIYISIENLIGSEFNDYLAGNGSDNKIYGLGGDDTLWGYGGTRNELFGGDGVDTIVGSSGIDIMDGGTGTDVLRMNGDTVSYQLSTAGVIASLFDQSINTGDAKGDVYTNMEDLTGSDFADTLYGDNGALNNLLGLAGDDKIYGLGGQDIMIGDAGADYLDGGDGEDIADYETYLFTKYEFIGAPHSGVTGVTASLLDRTKNTADAAGDTYVNIENLAGSLVDDILEGDNNNNVILGWPGADTLRGMGGNDVLEGMPGADFLDGGEGEDVASYASAGTLVIASWGFYTTVGSGVTASMLDPSKNTNDAAGDTYANIENLLGSGFADTLEGNNLSNTIFGQNGNDTLLGQGGDDTLVGGAGADATDGGAGYDTAVYTLATAGVTVALDNSLTSTGEATGDTFVSVEGLHGSKFDDTLRGDGNSNTLAGDDGNDTLQGGAGDDQLLGGLGNDTLDGGEGNDTIFGDAGADTIAGGNGTDLLSYEHSASGVTIKLGGTAGTSGDATGDVVTGIENVIGSAFGDTITGDGTANRLLGGAGNDTLAGGGAATGEDHLEGGAGGDTLDGTGGYAYADYVTATAGVSAYLTWEAGGSGDAAGDHFIDIEGIIGSQFADVLAGNDKDNTLQGADGNDWLFGFEGSDFLVGGNGNDVLAGGLGSDLMDGGDGQDVAYYRDAAETVFSVAAVGNKSQMVDGHKYGISYDASNAVNGFGEAYLDQLNNIENIWGSHFDDIIRGGAESGQVYGFEGNDILDGRAGEDNFYGGTGSDTITMGEGADISFYLSWNDHVNIYGTPEPYEGGDTYTDFVHGEDRIVLSRYWFGFGNIPGPAAALTSDYADFVTNGVSTSSKPTLLWDAAARTLSFDADGTGATAAVLLGTFQAGATMTLSDIWTA